MAQRKVSPEGRQFTYDHEGGAVKKAYRDAVGKWTIGAGLTAASGVIVPKAGMVITEAEADRLFDLAVDRNYMPRVIKALGENASQFAIDAGVSFDWNTGAINRASWVKSYLAKKAAETRAKLGLWNKAGGKVLRGLTRRRAEEADILLLGKYPAGIKVSSAPVADSARFAVFVVSITPAEIEEVSAGLKSIGYDPGIVTGMILRSAVEAFQKAYDLTVDGKVGRATLSTLQRELDARRKAKSGAVTTAASTTVAAGDQAVSTVTAPAPADPTSVVPDHIASWIGGGIAIIAVAYLAWQAYQYRDIIAVRVADKAPRLANWLRSF